MDGYIWVRVGAYGCIGVGEREKQTRKDTHGLNAHDFPATMAGKFPNIHVLVRGDTGRVTTGNRWSRIVVGAKTKRI